MRNFLKVAVLGCVLVGSGCTSGPTSPDVRVEAMEPRNSNAERVGAAGISNMPGATVEATTVNTDTTSIAPGGTIGSGGRGGTIGSGG
jgi:hypothetical protein